MNTPAGTLAPYVPRVASEWDSVAPGSMWRAIDGSLVFVDISGFTNLSERLSRKGRIGAEELTAVLNRVFGQMLEEAFRRGGSLLKFGGDALLLFFDSPDHVMQACAAVVEMRAALRDAAKEPTSVGRIQLKMSSGVHTGSVDFFLVGESHRELIVAGPMATTTTDMEGTADAGEIVVSTAVKEQLPKDFIGEPKGEGWLLRKQKINWDAPGPVHREPVTEEHLATFVSTDLREYLGSHTGDSEHRIATVGFIKFKGVDALIEEVGPEAVAKELDILVRAVQQGADREQITFLASDIDANGGKIILTAGVPTSRHDDEGRMLRAARTLLDARCGLSVRMGVNRGHVFSGGVGTMYRRTYTVMGDTVNLAARLMATAGPSELYASPTVLDLSTTLFATEALEPFHVKGKDDLIQAYAVKEEQGVRPPETKHELPFAGRDQELQLIVGIVTTCAATGSGGMLTITGATGVGKTRLIAEVLESCPDMDVLMVQAEPNGTNVPYWAFRDPMRRLLEIEWGSQDEMASVLEKTVKSRAPALEWALPLIGDVLHIEIPDNEQTGSLDPQFRPTRTADAVIELLDTTCPGPFAAVAEDGHWMDAASITLLTRIGETAQRRPWTVIFTSWDDSDFESQGTEVRLDRLDDEAVRSITIQATEAAPLRPHELDAIVNRAGGNPLFLSEILQMVRSTGNADSLPESLDAIVSSEIDTLQPLTRQVLRYASVIGRSFAKITLDELLRGEELELDGATQKALGQFIEIDDGDRFRFRHAVVHDAAYEGLSYRRRRQLHLRAGEVIEKLAGKNPESAAESLASHYYLSGKYDKAWHYSRVAADKARRAYANAEAAVHYRHAIETAQQLPSVDPSAVADLWTKLGEVRDQAGQYEQAREAYSRALKATSEDPLREAALYLKRAEAWFGSGSLKQAKRNLTLGRKRLSPLTDEQSVAALARFDAYEAGLQMARGDFELAHRCATRAVERATSADEREALARAYYALDGANFMLGRDEPRKGEEAIEIYQDLGLLERSVNVMNNLGAYSYWEGKWDEAADWYRKSVETSEKSGNIFIAALARANTAEVLIGQRRFEEAIPLLDHAERTYRASNSSHYLPLIGLLSARVQLGLGHIDEAIEELTALLSAQTEGERTAWTAETAVSLGDALASAGRPKDSLESIDRFFGDSPSDAEEMAAAISRVRGRCLELMGDVAAAEEALSRGLELAESANDFYQEALIREARVETRSRAGLGPDPADLSRLDELFDRLGVLVSQPI